MQPILIYRPRMLFAEQVLPTLIDVLDSPIVQIYDILIANGTIALWNGLTDFSTADTVMEKTC